jgi:hypothetical protein
VLKIQCGECAGVTSHSNQNLNLRR